jgi:hypothetical protein
MVTVTEGILWLTYRSMELLIICWSIAMETHNQFSLCTRTPCLQRRCVICVIKAATKRLAIFWKVCTSCCVHRKKSLRSSKFQTFLPICMGPIHPSIHPPTYRLTYLPVLISPSVSLSIDLSIYIYVSGSLYTSVCLSAYLSVYLHMFLSKYLSLFVPACVPVRLSVSAKENNRTSPDFLYFIIRDTEHKKGGR